MRLGRVAGVPIFLSPSWLLPAAFLTVLYADDFAPAGTTPGVRAHLLAFGIAVLVALSVLVHELAHVVVARLLGLPVRQVVIHLIGGVSEIQRKPETPAREYLVAVVGPLSSLLVAGVARAALPLAHGHDARAYLAYLAFVNLLLGVLNVLPGLPLDGGRVVRAAVWQATGDEPRASVAAAGAGRVLAVCIGVAPLAAAAVLGPSGSNTADLDVLWGALVGMYVWGGATVELRFAELRRRLPRLRVRSLVRSTLPVPGDLPLSEAIRRARATGARALVTVDAAGRPDGIVPEDAVAATPEHQQPWVSVSALARRLEPTLTVPADTAGEDLLETLRRAPASEYLVVEHSGEVLGVLSTRDVQAVLTAPAAPR